MNSYFRYNFKIHVTQTHDSKKSKYGSKYRHLSALAQCLDIDLIKLLHNIFVAYKKKISRMQGILQRYQEILVTSHSVISEFLTNE